MRSEETMLNFVSNYNIRGAMEKGSVDQGPLFSSFFFEGQRRVSLLLCIRYRGDAR